MAITVKDPKLDILVQQIDGNVSGSAASILSDDDVATWMSSSQSTPKCIFRMENKPIGRSISSVELKVTIFTSQKTPNIFVEPFIKLDGVEYPGSLVLFPNSRTEMSGGTWGSHPATGEPFQPGDIHAAEMGFSFVMSGPGTGVIYEFWAEITHDQQLGSGTLPIEDPHYPF